MSDAYQRLNGNVDAALRKLKGYPADLNSHNQRKLEDLKRYCSDRIIKEPVLDYAITCKNCGYSLSDILNYTALVPTKNNDCLIFQSEFIEKAPKPEPDTRDGSPDQSPVPKKPRNITLCVQSQTMTVGNYRNVLSEQLQRLAGLNDTEEIELDEEN